MTTPMLRERGRKAWSIRLYDACLCQVFTGLVACIVLTQSEIGVKGLNQSASEYSISTARRQLLEEDYWAKEAKALGLLVHFNVPEEERAPNGNVPAELVYQQRYHPHTGVNWAKVQDPPEVRKWQKLPGDLEWRTVFIGCKEIKRPAWQHARQTPDTCKIYVLDASDVAEKIGVPRCDVNNFAIDPRKSMILPNPRRLPYPLPVKDSRISNAGEMYPWKVGAHYLAQSGGPYFFAQALNNSIFRAETPEDADAVFVYDYCYMIWGLAESHSTKHWWLKDIVKYQPNPNILTYMGKIHDEILASPRFNKLWGKEYIWWLPHTAVFARKDIFGSEPIDRFFQEIGCNMARGSLFLAPTVYMKWRCTLYHPERVLVVPQASMEVTTGNSSVKDIFIMFKANCEQPDYYSVGKFLRSMLTKSLVKNAGNATDLLVQCLNTVIGSPGYNEQSHHKLMETLFRSTFCPVIPGDSQTSQHLTERYIAGCIPVFVGPPYHTMPFEKEVDYAESAVFLNITDSKDWLRDDVMEWEFPMVPSAGWAHDLLNMSALERESESPKWWFPWIEMSHLMTIEKLDDIIPTLRSIPAERVAALQRGVMKERSKFLYVWGSPGMPGAIDIVLDNICHFVGKKCEPHTTSRKSF